MHKINKTVLAKSILVTALAILASWALIALSFQMMSIDSALVVKAKKMAFTIAGIVPMLVAFPSSYYLFTQQSKFEKVSRKLAYLLKYDQLTAVLTRRAFFQEARLKLEKPDNTELSKAVFFVDLDHFKQINDGFGHAMGDEILRILGKVLSKEFCEGELVGRLGGEEFCIFAQNYTQESATDKAQQLVDRFQQAAAIVDGVLVNCTLSIGVVVSSTNDSIDELIAAADKHLYRAKKKGRNRIAGSEREKVAA